MSHLFHVSSSSNRESIRTHGLDSTRMGVARGIAGSRRPEQVGVFLCTSESEAEWFVRMNNTGGPVDMWAVDGIGHRELVESPEGFSYLPRSVGPECLELLRQDVSPSA